KTCFCRKDVSIDGSTPVSTVVRLDTFARVAPINPYVLLRSTHSQGDRQCPEHEEAFMANKSAHKEDRKKQASSLKEKRAAKKAKRAKPASPIPPTGH
ncbi:hypothetical protein ABNF97_33720, partial [Plantactinospora sp. B6F1]|uniref:hypothetical protein n=1 Tax=Plantactinospora sp. B6F1 TaxID=3158971 RepID=UPI0032D95A32